MKRLLKILYLPLFVVTIYLVYETVTTPVTSPGFQHMTSSRRALDVLVLMLPLAVITLGLLWKHKRDEAATTKTRARSYANSGSGSS